MEIIKARQEPNLLTSLRVLDKRMNLTYEDKQYMLNLEKGFEGEQLFDQFIARTLDVEAFILNDVLLTVKNSSFQIDSLIITGETFFIYEIKNYEGRYLMKSDQLLTLTGQEIASPLTQLKKSVSLMRQALSHWNVAMPVEPAVVFINSRFSLFHARPEDPMVLPTDLVPYFTKMNQRRMRPLTKKHRLLAEKLLSEHREEVPYQKQLPAFDYDDLRKGVNCSKCGSFEVVLTQRSCYCKECKGQASLEETVIQNIKNFKLLYPGEKVTSQAIYSWCGQLISDRRIRRILKNHYTQLGLTKGVFYDDNSKD